MTKRRFIIRRPRPEDLQSDPPPALIGRRGKGKTDEVQKKPGRNDPCVCGSGKKYKRCCLTFLQEIQDREGKQQ